MSKAKSKPKRKRTKKMSEADILDAEGIGSNGNGKKNGNGKFDPYQVVTDKILDYMESGKFEKLPELWARSGGPRNAHTGRAYNGINILLLMMRMDEEQWEKPLFLTFNQVKAANKLDRFKDLYETEVDENGDERTIYPAFVKKGSKGEQVCFWKRIKVNEWDEDKGQTVEKTIPLLRLYTVFNIDQIEAKPEVREYLERHAKSMAKYENDGERNKAVESFVRNVGVDVKHGGDRAFYMWDLDRIGMPISKVFATMDAYYAVLFHEHVHATGHESRLARDLKNRFGSDAYAFEELVAEFGSAFLCADFGIHQKEWRHHAEYIRVWTKRMREDKHAIFKAASLANAAVNFLWEKQPEDLRNADAD